MRLSDLTTLRIGGEIRRLVEARRDRKSVV